MFLLILLLKIKIMWIEYDRELLNDTHVHIFKENPNDTILRFHDNYLGCIGIQIIPELTDKYTEIDIIKSKDVNYLSNYTDEQLKVELDKRKLARREKRANIPRCRNCKHFKPNNLTADRGHCLMQEKRYRTGIRCHKVVIKYTKACNNYENIIK